jgi:hypothetical protein
MTDLQMTARCAAAMGIEVRNNRAPFEVREWSINHANGTCSIYEPLHNDEQAMALMKRFKLHCVVGDLSHLHWMVAPHGNMPDCSTGTDLNRAIVECVAGLEKT